MSKKLRNTVEEYLAIERQADGRHEYLDGQIYAMAGESLAHSQICINLAGELRMQLKGRPCQALSSNMKVRTSPASLFSYPDMTIVCGDPVFHEKHQDVLINPNGIIEVLSPSTEGYDRGEKFFRYRSNIETFTDYVLISQAKPLIEHLARQPDDRWLYSAASGLEADLHIASIDCRLRLDEIYDRTYDMDPRSGFRQERNHHG